MMLVLCKFGIEYFLKETDVESSYLCKISKCCPSSFLLIEN